MSFLLTYLLGGLTFFPLLLTITAVCLFLLSEPLPQGDTPPEQPQLEPESESHASDILPRLYRAGWLTVRRSYNDSSSESGYMGLITNSYRNFIDNRSNQPKRTRPKELFYAVLKQNVLFLYPDEDQVECTAAIKVSLYQVDLFPTGSPDPELFVKRKAIRLTPTIVDDSSQSDQTTTSSSTHDQPQPDHPADHQPASRSPWFIFAKNNLEKEDWYHLLLAASKLAQPDSKATFKRDTSLFDSQDMAKLVEGIDQQPDPIPMRWMNAMLGRLFLSIYRTHAFENWIIDRIMKKLTKVQTPSFLSAIKVREVHVGSTTPFFSKPMLKDLTVDGDASMEVLVNYKGQFKITIETMATINLGARFKPYVVNLVLAVVLKELSGTLLLKIKRPPTNRLWFGFTTMPHLILDLQPVVSTRQIKWALVLKPIESRIREVVMESLVYPNLDDLVFFDTQSYTHHGGIWGDAARKENSSNEARDDQAPDPPANIEESKPKNDSSQQTDPQPSQKTSLSTAREDSSRSQDTLRLRAKSSSLGDSSSDSITVGEPSDSHSTPLIIQSENKRSSWFSAARRQDTASTQSSQNSIRNQVKTRPVGQESSDLEDGDAVAMLQKFLRSHPEASTSSSPAHTPTMEGKPPTPNSSVSQATPLPEPLEIDSAGPTNALSNKPIHAEPLQLVTGGQTDDKVDISTPSVPNHSKPLRSVPPPPPHSLPAAFLPPPQRIAPSMRSPSATNNQPSNGSILNQLRTRATDKEALAASVTQARDVVIKWGASWTSKRKSPQANNSMYPYNSGFNPIRIDEVEQIQDPKISVISTGHKLSDSTDSTQNPLPKVLSETRNEDEPNLEEASKPNRDQLTIEKTQTSADLSSSTSNSIPQIASPLQEDSSLEDAWLKQDKQKNSQSNSIIATTNYHNSNDESNGNGKRNRIFSSNGQFVPPAPQSTTGLSLPSSPQPDALASDANTSNTTLVALVDDRSTSNASKSRSGELIRQDLKSSSRSPPTGKKGGILSERSSYKPAPMMAIPGIRDSSHRFGLGSDSISKLQLQQPPVSDLIQPSTSASSDTSLGLSQLVDSETVNHPETSRVLGLPSSSTQNPLEKQAKPFIQENEPSSYNEKEAVMNNDRKLEESVSRDDGIREVKQTLNSSQSSSHHDDNIILDLVDQKDAKNPLISDSSSSDSPVDQLAWGF